MRVPSGNEDDLLGPGAWGVKPFLVASFSYNRVWLLANFNVRFRIGGEGLADRATPLVGIEYTF